MYYQHLKWRIANTVKCLQSSPLHHFNTWWVVYSWIMVLLSWFYFKNIILQWISISCVFLYFSSQPFHHDTNCWQRAVRIVFEVKILWCESYILVQRYSWHNVSVFVFGDKLFSLQLVNPTAMMHNYRTSSSHWHPSNSKTNLISSKTKFKSWCVQDQSSGLNKRTIPRMVAVGTMRKNKNNKKKKRSMISAICFHSFFASGASSSFSSCVYLDSMVGDLMLLRCSWRRRLPRHWVSWSMLLSSMAGDLLWIRCWNSS